MTPTKLLLGQILIVFAIISAGVWAATQWAASMLAYQPELGPPWFGFLGMPIYRPWALFWWWFHFDAYARPVFDKSGALAGASGFIGCGAAVGGSLWRARQSRQVTTYGSARWAKADEIVRAGLRGRAGAILGELDGAYLRHDGPEHIMAFAPTRSGKGVGLVVPTLLAWTGSAVIHDIKGENWSLTAGWRARFSHCLLFNPTEPRSARYNPLLEVRRGPDEVRDVQNIADILVDPVITTDRRTYHLALISTRGVAMSALSWTYPSDALIALKAADSQKEAVQPVSAALEIDHLNFDYAIRGPNVSWRPLRAFDDGRQVFIEFPATLGSGEAPPLFVVGKSGSAQLVNYRLRGHYYVVDRLFDAAELRIGGKDARTVHIIRDDGKSGHRS